MFDGAVLRAAHPNFLLLTRPSAHPRLGLVIGKKHVRRAHDRNLIKRVARECFRLRQHQLPPVDAIVLARRGADQLGAMELCSIFNGLWKRIEKRARSAAIP